MNGTMNEWTDDATLRDGLNNDEVPHWQRASRAHQGELGASAEKTRFDPWLQKVSGSFKQLNGVN